MHSTDPEQLNRTFLALADPTRRAILGRLAAGEATVSELMAPFALSQPTISKHLKVLEQAGLIEQGRDAQRRPRRLAPAALDDAGRWIDDFHTQWAARFDRLETHLAARRAAKKKSKDA
ncbi:MAG TPA: metalloregulator ArsR/SmtB family transcription factor [Caulobacteraceae bacterium]|nr:metalloregulator ArsR/SmtB family transcription factor [Caulobacteraceae bacterium]